MGNACLSLFVLVLGLPVRGETIVPQPASKDCVRLLDGPVAPQAAPSSTTGVGPPTYDVTHGVGTQNPQPACYLIFDPNLPGPPDDVVTFDGIPEQTRADVFGTIPTVVEQETPMGGGQSQIQIQTNAPPGRQLFPGGLQGPQGQPLTDACFFIGLTRPLDLPPPRQVTQASITLLRNGSPVAGPIDISGPQYFTTPWNGQLGVRIPGAAGAPLAANGVVVNIMVLPMPNICYTDADCDDGDMCTVDKCINGACVYTLLKDTLSREEALRASHGPAKSCFPSGSCPVVPYGETTNMRDAWMTPERTDGATEWRIGTVGSDPPIPADFFGPGSEPFSGVIALKGDPLGVPGFGDADTLVLRSADPFERTDPVGPTEITVEIEIVALNLVSIDPITVTHSGGTTTQWNVRAGLSDCDPPAGTLTAKKTHCNGGTFTSVLNVQPKITFTRVDNPSDVRVLDTGCENPPIPFDSLSPPGPIAWVHDISPELCVADNYASSFHPGLPEGQSTVCGDLDVDNDCDVNDFLALLRAYGKVGGQAGYNGSLDYDTDGAITYADYLQWLGCYRCGLGDVSARPPAPGTLGDMNGDGNRRGDDIAGFVACVLGGTAPTICDNADIDQNGVEDEQDVPAFLLLVMELN